MEKLDESHHIIYDELNTTSIVPTISNIKNNNNNKHVLRSVLQIILYILMAFRRDLFERNDGSIHFSLGGAIYDI